MAAAGVVRRGSLIGGLAASVPLVSVPVLVWLYVDPGAGTRHRANEVRWSMNKGRH